MSGKPSSAPSIWTINAGHQGSGPNNLDLVGCQLKAVIDANNKLQYAFLAPGVGGGSSQQVAITTSGTTTSRPTPPFQFPMFNSALSQGAGAQSLPWYITVCSLTDGANNKNAKGTYSNSSFQSCDEGITGAPPDVWVAQAGSK